MSRFFARAQGNHGGNARQNNHGGAQRQNGFQSHAQNQNGDVKAEGEGIWCGACRSSNFLPRRQSHSFLSQGQKQYSKQTVYDAHLTSKKHIKAAARQATGGSSASQTNGTTSENHVNGSSNSKESRIRASASLTFLTTSLLSKLIPILNETRSNVERRFALTAKEREAELAEKPAAAPAPAANGDEKAEEEEEEEERIYNPLKLPLGWDGKPIPYWLYKLHGLGVEYRCEICSDHVYMGR